MIINNLYTYVSDCGSGDVVLLLHGWGGSHDSFAGLTNSLQTDFRVVCPDLWGFGQSQEPLSNTQITDYADMVYELLYKMDISKVRIIGHSFGGRLGIILASKYPNIIQSLVLLSSAGLKFRPTIKKRLQIYKYKHIKQKVLKNKLDKSILDKFGSSDYRNSSVTMRQILVNVVNKDLKNYAKSIDIPTMIVNGKKDKDTPPKMAKYLHKYIKNSKIEWLDGNHYAYLDEHDKFLNTCYNFWEKLI